MYTLNYKNYIGVYDFSKEDGVYQGKLIGISDSVSFEGETPESLMKDFHHAVDEYIEFLKTKDI